MSDLRKPIVVLHESFRKFVEKYNVLSNNVGEPLFLKTHNDSDIVTTINEINATFNPFEGKIVYPNDSVPTGAAFDGYDGNGDLTDYPSYTGAQLPSTHLTITTNQHGGQDIDIDAGRDFLVDAVRHINLTGVNFDGDYSGNYVSKVDGTSLDSVGGAMTLTGNSTYNINTKSTFTVQTGVEGGTTASIDLNATGDVYLDAGGDIYLDAGDSDIVFRRNGPSNNYARWQMGTEGNPNNFKLNVGKGDFTVDVAGDIVLDAGDSDILFNRNGDTYVKTQMGMSWDDTVTRVQYSQGSVEFEAANNIIFDAAGDIVFDADGNEFVFRNGAGADSARMNFADDGDLVFSVPGHLEFDVERDIILDAKGNNITFKDEGTTRQVYTLGGTISIATTGNRTETVSGDVSDSAAGTYHIGATGNMDIDTQGTFQVDNVGAFTVNATGASGRIDLNASEHIVLDATKDIYLDAGDSDIFFQRNGDTFGRWQMGIPTNSETFHLSVPRGNFQIDAAGDIVLDAGDSDIIFTRNGDEFIKTRMGITGAPSRVRHVYSQGGVEFQTAGGDITLDAAGDDIRLEANSVEYGKFRHIGDNQLGIYSNGILALSFNDSDAVFNSDVNIEDNLDVDGTLNVDGATTLNGHVDLGDTAADDISINGKVDTNILPKTNNANNIGSSTNQWRHAWFDGTVFADNLDGDSGTIANFNFLNNTMTGTSNIILDAVGDIILDAADSDVIFKRDGTTYARWKMGIAHSPNTFALATTQGNFHVDATGDIILDAGDSDIQFWRNGVSYEKHRLGVDGDVNQTRIEYPQGSLFLDVSGDIIMEADGGDVYLKDDGTQFARFQNSSNNLKLYSGTTAAMTFSGANVTMAGQITLPDADLNTTTKTVHGAINEVDSDLGERTSLSSFYDGHKDDIVTALNRVAARVIDVYDENGNLLNP